MIAEVSAASSLAEAFIYGTLAADALLALLVGDRIFAGVADEGTPYPLVTFQGVGGVDTTAPGFRRVMTTLRYAVHCADRVGSIAGLDAVAARVDALLQGGTYTWSNGSRLLACTREQTIVLGGAIAGVQTRDMVLTFMLQVQEATAG